MWNSLSSDSAGLSLQVLSSQVLNAVGLALDIVGFSIVFALALPAVMRRNFVASDRVDLDGVWPDSGQIARLQNPERAKRLEQRRNRRQTAWYFTGGVTVVVGFALQLVALFVPYLRPHLDAEWRHPNEWFHIGESNDGGLEFLQTGEESHRGLAASRGSGPMTRAWEKRGLADKLPSTGPRGVARRRWRFRARHYRPCRSKVNTRPRARRSATGLGSDGAQNRPPGQRRQRVC